MVIGSAALAALPLTSGYFSKDAILLTSFDYPSGGPWFWGIGALAAFLTTIYTVRMIVIAFFGTAKTEAHDHSGINMSGPLLVLAVLSLVGGFIGLAPLALVMPDGGVEGHHGGALAFGSPPRCRSSACRRLACCSCASTSGASLVDTATRPRAAHVPAPWLGVRSTSTMR